MNRETIQPGGAGLYPLQGDVTSSAGNNRATVTGLQNVPILAATPGPANNLQYNANTNDWTPTAIACISVDGVAVSYDYVIAVDVTPFVAVS